MPQVEVAFDIDANGILNVTARDKASGREQKVTITASTNLSKQEVERMVDEAKRHGTEDKGRRDLVEARNQADTLAYQAEKALRDLGGNVPAADRGRIEDKIGQLREAMKSEDVGRIRRLSEEVQQASYALGQQISAQASPGTSSGSSGGSNGGSAEDVVEGEFHEA
jgi:molecular chaperone DnaK